MAYKISGRVIHVGPPYPINSSNGATHIKRDLIIAVRRYDPNTGQPTDDPRNTPKFSFFNDKAQILERIKVGDIVVVDFSIFGRTYEREGRTEYITDVSPNSVYPERASFQQLSSMPHSQSDPQTTSQPPQQTFGGYPNPTSPYGQNTVTVAPKTNKGKDDDLPF